MQIFDWITAHLDQIKNLVETVIWFVGLLIARGYIRDKRITQLYEDAVAFAAQWKRVEAKKGNTPTNYDVNNRAVRYLRDHGIDPDTDRLEAAVHVVKRVKAACAPPKG